MNRIGLPATGQQAILSNCHDMYTIEVRHRGTSEWFSTGFTKYPAPIAYRFVNELNASGHLVFRSTLVEASA